MRKVQTKNKPQAKPARAAIVKQAVTVPQRLLEDRRREESTLIGALISAASNPNTDVDKMERLWIIHKEAVAARAEQEFSFAKNALALEIPPIPKNHKIEFKDKNGHIQSTPYANREDIERIIGPIYRRHGFSTEYSTQYVDGKIQTVLIVRHNSGHKEIYTSPPMPLDSTGSKNNNQAAGSTSEYGMRYALKGAFNIIGIDIDDDGSIAGDSGRTKPVSRFDQRAAGGKTIDATVEEDDHSGDLSEIGDEQNEWDGKTIFSGRGKSTTVDFGNDPVKAAAYLRGIIKNHKTKEGRIELITLNTALTRRLIKDKKTNEIDALHALADKGEK